MCKYKRKALVLIMGLFLNQQAISFDQSRDEELTLGTAKIGDPFFETVTAQIVAQNPDVLRNGLHFCSHEGCDKAYIRKQSLALHIISHSGKRDFLCPHPRCGKAYVFKSGLNRHIKTSHSITRLEAKRHVCTYEDCDSSFDEKQGLVIHIRTHTGERPYSCHHEGCDKSFAQQGTLSNHLSTMHPSTGMPSAEKKRKLD